MCDNSAIRSNIAAQQATPDEGLEPFEARANPDVEDPLAHWDAVVQDLDETPVLIVLL